MLRFDFTDDELEKIKKQVRFTPRQLKIIEYRRQEKTLVEMSQLIHRRDYIRYIRPKRKNFKMCLEN